MYILYSYFPTKNIQVEIKSRYLFHRDNKEAILFTEL